MGTFVETGIDITNDWADGLRSQDWGMGKRTVET